MANCPSCKTDNGYWGPTTDTQPWCDECREAPKFRYYMVNRPPGFATIPENWFNYEAWMPMKQEPNSEWFVHGWVEFTHRLDPEVIWKWELRPADQTELEAYWDWREEVGM